MIEKTAAAVLASPLSGPSQRFDAEQTLVLLGWPPLAIALVKASSSPALVRRVLS